MSSEAAEDQGWVRPERQLREEAEQQSSLVDRARSELEESASAPDCDDETGKAMLAETRRLVEQRRRERLESHDDQ